MDPRPEPGTSGSDRSPSAGRFARRRTIPRWGAFEAVLFDFGHTLFDSTDLASRCSRFEAAARLKLDVDGFRSVWDAIRARSREPIELARGRDLGATAHTRCWLELLASDTGWDVRPVFAAHGLDELVDAFELSYEHGVCKPDARIFDPVGPGGRVPEHRLRPMRRAVGELTARPSGPEVEVTGPWAR